jgi:uncharacterized protein
MSNVADKPISEMVFSGWQKDFDFAKRDTLPNYCRQCPHLKLCWGECPKNCIICTWMAKSGSITYAEGFKRFFVHAQPHLKHMASLYLQSRASARRQIFALEIALFDTVLCAGRGQWRF